MLTKGAGDEGPGWFDQLKKSSLNWQNLEMQQLKEYQKDNEKLGTWANYKAQEGVAYDYYAKRRASVLMESKIEMGIFVLASGRWALDNQVEDVILFSN